MKKTIFKIVFVITGVIAALIIDGFPKLIQEGSYYKLGFQLCCTIGLLYLSFRLLRMTRSDEVKNHPL
jgi:hypothetical protein